MMKKGSNNGFLALVALFVFLLVSSSSSARLLTGEQKVTEGAGDELSNLMGTETCDGRDEECLQRRMVADAHLDYIYTQSRHHQPERKP